MALRVTPVPHVSIRGAEISQMSNVVIVNGFIMMNLLNMVTWFCAGLLFLFKKQHTFSVVCGGSTTCPGCLRVL